MTVSIHCHIPSDGAVGMNAFIIVGITLSYIPQWATIIYRRSSMGISPIFLFVGSLSAFWSVTNKILLDFDIFSCCSVYGYSECNKLLLNDYQLLIQWLSLTVVFILFMMYFTQKKERFKEWRLSRYLCFSYFMIMILFTIVEGIIVWKYGSHSLSSYAVVVGYISLVLVCVQYVPQVWTVYQLKDNGSFSIPMLMLQCPGTFVWVYFLITGEDPAISTWLSFLVTASFQLILLMLCIYYFVRNRRITQYRAIDSLSDIASDDEEQTNLIPNERRRTTSIVGRFKEFVGFTRPPQENYHIHIERHAL